MTDRTADAIERSPDELGGRYEFAAGADVEVDWWNDEGQPVTSTWYTVRLPHQCDSWEITRTRTREEAISEMETFIREAQEALARLRDAP